MTNNEAIEQLEEAIADLSGLHAMIGSVLNSTSLDVEGAAVIECIGKLLLTGINKADATTVTFRAAIRRCGMGGAPANPFDEAYARFTAARASTLASNSNDATIDRLADAEKRAFDSMIVQPITDGHRAALKLQAIVDTFDVPTCGLDRDLGRQVLSEVLTVLRSGGEA